MDLGNQGFIMCSRNIDDFWTHYRILCLQSKVCPQKSVLKFIQRTELCLPVEAVRKEHWPFLLQTLQTDNSLSKIEFSCNLSHASQQQTSKKKQRIMGKYFPVPYGCSATNISHICRALTSVIQVSLRLRDVRLENLVLKKEDIVMLADSISHSHIKILSFADSQIDDETLEALCQKLYNSQISCINFSSCNLSGERLKSLCRLMKFNKSRRAKDMYFMGLRNHTPVLDEMEGLNRVTLNDNEIGDDGVEMIMEYLEDDLWIKVLDFQKCGIGNEGAKCLINALKTNVTFEAIDLRLNKIDRNLIDKINLQLNLNNAGKELMLCQGPVWQPRKLTIRTPKRRVLRTKVFKSPPPKIKIIQKKPPSTFEMPTTAFKFSHDMLNLKSLSLEDASSQTEIVSVDEELKKIQKTLSNEIKLRECLMHLLKKYKMENCMLRKQIEKLSKLDDHILIDQETFSEVKNTFEKFKRFLNVMKEYGLFECIAMLGVNENTDIVLKPMIVNATKKCMQLIENEPSSPTTSTSDANDSLLLNENIKLQTEESPNPVNWYPCLNPDIQAALNQNGTSTGYGQEQKEYNSVKKSSSDKALVQRVYREVRENYSNSSHSGHPSFPPKLIARRPEIPVRKRPKEKASKSSVMKDISKIEATHKLKHLRTPKEFYSAATKDADQCDACEVQNSLSLASTSARTSGIHGLVHKKTVSSQTPSSATISGGAQQSVSSVKTDAGESQKVDKTLTSSASNKNPGSSSSTLHDPGNSALGALYKLPPNARPKLKGSTTKRGKIPSLNSPSIGSSISKNVSNVSMGSQNLTLSEVRAAASLKPSKAEEKTHSSALTSATKSKPNSSSSSVDSYNSQEGIEQGPIYSSEGKNDSSKSYLESVSDASTDKDVKSLAESEVYSLASVEKGASKPPSEPSAPVDAASNESKSSKSSKKKRSKKSSPNVSLNQGNLKKNASDSSVPSLSDITTISSRSLNTDSVLGQLSNDES